MKRFLSLTVALCLLLTLVAVSAVAEGKTIVYWSMWNSAEPQAKALQEGINAYMAKTGNKVDVQFKGRTGIREGLEPALEANTVIDMFDEDIDRVNTTWGKYLMDLEDFAKASNYEETANALLISECRKVGNGKLMSIPYQPNVFAMFYNQEAFEKAGITAVPATWEDFLAACQKLKDAGFIPLTTDDAYIDTNFGYHLARLLGNEGVSKVVKEGLWAEEPVVLKAAQAYEDLAEKGYLSPTVASAVWPANQSEFALGMAAMYLNGSWLPNEVRDIAGDDFVWGCFAYPTLEGGVNGHEASNFGAQVFGVNKNSQVGKEAFELIEFLTKGEFDLKLSQESLGIPSDTRNTEWPKQLAPVKSVLDGLSIRWNWAAGIEDNADIFPVIKENLQRLYGGTITAQEFVDTLEAAHK